MRTRHQTRRQKCDHCGLSPCFTITHNKRLVQEYLAIDKKKYNTPLLKKTFMLEPMNSTLCTMKGTMYRKAMPPRECFMDYMDGFVSDDDEIEDIFVPAGVVLPRCRSVTMFGGGTMHFVKKKDVEEAIDLNLSPFSQG